MNPPLEQTVKQLEQQLDEVRGENEKLRKDHGEYVLGKATLMDLAVRNGSLTASMGTEMAHIWAEQFHSVLESTKAENYVECMFNTKDGKMITVTVQRHEKKTPHQFRMELETTVETLRQQLKEKESEIDKMKDERSAFHILLRKDALTKMELYDKNGALEKQIKLAESVIQACRPSVSENGVELDWRSIRHALINYDAAINNTVKGAE